MHVWLLEPDANKASYYQDALREYGYLVHRQLTTDKSQLSLMPVNGGGPIAILINPRWQPFPQLALRRFLRQYSKQAFVLWLKPEEDIQQLHYRLLKQWDAFRQARPLKVGEFMLDHTACSLNRQGIITSLTPCEYHVMARFFSQPNKIIAKAELAALLPNHRKTQNPSKTLEVIIHHLRKKIGREYIRTHFQQGYSFISHPILNSTPLSPLPKRQSYEQQQQ